MAIKTDAVWTEIDVASLDQSLRNAHKAYKDAYVVMKAAREGFEQAMNDAAGLPVGKRLVFGYRFGKLSVAVVDDDRKPVKPKASSQSLADYLKAQANH